MGTLHGGNDAFDFCQPLESGQCFLVICRNIVHDAGILEIGVLRPHAGIVQACRYGIGFHHLPILFLEKIAVCAVKDSRLPGSR